MKPATINTSTFTLTGASGPVTGSVTYSAGLVATFTPSANLSYNTVYTATITTGAANTLGIDTAQNYTWTFTTTTPPPTVVSTIPANGATGVPVTQALTATFNEAMSSATINASTFTLTGPGGVITAAITYNSSGFIATFTPATNLAYSTLYKATITTGAQDLAGTGLVTSYSWTFTTAAPPLLVLSTTPVNAATGVRVTQALTATFNQPLNCTTLTSPATTFIVRGPAATPIAGAVTCAGSIATFTPTSDLALNTLYTATITTGAADTAGTPLASNYVWSFITLPAAAPPTVISTVPVNLATNVPVNQAVLAAFSEAMTATTIDAATFTLAGPGSTAVTGTVTYTPSGSVATFTPSAPLAYHTLYTATIATGATGLTGVALASNYVWTFTTAATPIALAPTVLSTIPANLATNVPLSRIITATFSEAMSPPAISSTNFTLKVTGGATVAGVVAYASVGNTLTFTPTTNLAPSTQYTATITTGVTNLSGTPLANAYVWTFTTGTLLDTTAPQLVSTSPANTATNVPINSAVSGTFSEAMNPLTISTSTFTLTGPGSTAVVGTVSYDALDFIATFTPNANLLPSTQYTATITNGATNLAANSLAAGGVPNPWVFTTGATVVPPPVVLGPTVSLFGAFGGSAGITNQGTETVINGGIGTTGASTLITGFYDQSVPAVAGVYPCSYTVTPLNAGLVNGAIDTAPPPPTVGCPNEGTATTMATATQALLEAQTAYTTLKNLPPGTILSTNELGNRTLAPGTYTSASFYDITAGPLTLDAQGDPNATWVFQMGTYLTVGSPSATESIVLIGGAQAKNVFWQVGSAATINGAGGGTMVGTILAQAGVSVSTAGNAAITTIDGRLVSLTASVTVVNTIVNVPAQ
ncbi:MAG TPA: Ig-like domain-containing protein [Acidobacteriaceae bacterium]|nr:Ig-like domain-containing protein [Acidobacteriaceae bacterium]